MFGSAILEVGIGLIFIYWILSMIATHINEVIAGALGWRAKGLTDGIYAMLGDQELANKVTSHPLIRSLGAKPGRMPSYIPAPTFALALTDVVGADFVSTQERRSDPSDSQGRAALAGITAASHGDDNRARVGIEAWFNATMDRVSGVYKRKMLWLTMGVAAVLTLVISADTIAIATTLWQEQAIRSALTGAAQSTSNTGLEDAVNTLSQFALPIGWNFLPATVFGWFLKVVGLVITALAVSLGAPFWFDLLKLFTNPRSSGPKPNDQAETHRWAPLMASDDAQKQHALH